MPSQTPAQLIISSPKKKKKKESQLIIKSSSNIISILAVYIEWMHQPRYQFCTFPISISPNQPKSPLNFFPV